MSTIPQNEELLKDLFELLAEQDEIADQQRIVERLELLVMAEVFTFGRHTITQLLMSLGLTDQDWSAWYRLFSQGRFNYEAASAGLLAESLRYVAADEVYVVAGDATQTPRSSRKMEGSGWLRNLRTPPFMVGIHAAQRGFNRGDPTTLVACYSPGSRSRRRLCQQMAVHDRPDQPTLLVGDGCYDHLELWQALAQGVPCWHAVPGTGFCTTCRMRPCMATASMANVPLLPKPRGRPAISKSMSVLLCCTKAFLIVPCFW